MSLQGSYRSCIRLVAEAHRFCGVPVHTPGFSELASSRLDSTRGNGWLTNLMATVCELSRFVPGRGRGGGEGGRLVSLCPALAPATS